MKLVTLTMSVMVGLFLISCNKNHKQQSDEQNSELDGFGANANANVNLNINPIEIAKYVDEKNKGKTDAASFVQGLAEDTYFKLNVEARKRKIRPYNVAVCNMGQICFLQADEGSNYYFQKHTNNGTTYGVWGFRAGTFTNRGKGGWENWALIGCHDHKPGQGARPVRFEVCK